MLKIPNEMMIQIKQQAEIENPNECCGMILGPKNNKETLSRIRSCENVYDRFHEADPANFPRTAAKAYFIDPRELLAIQREMREAGEEIRVIYHSHINCGAYFSEEDIRVAAQEGTPAYPGVEYLVLSVMEGKVKETNLFHWDDANKTFVPEG